MKENEIKFRLRKITTGQFATIESVDVQIDSIRVNYGFGFGANVEHKIVGCEGKFEFLSKDVPFIILSVKCDFEIAPSTWEFLVSDEKGGIILPVSLTTHLATLTVGTARGILHSKTENTGFNKFFLPTLNVTESLKNDIEISTQKE